MNNEQLELIRKAYFLNNKVPCWHEIISYEEASISTIDSYECQIEALVAETPGAWKCL